MHMELATNDEDHFSKEPKHKQRPNLDLSPGSSTIEAFLANLKARDLQSSAVPDRFRAAIHLKHDRRQSISINRARRASTMMMRRHRQPRNIRSR